MSDKAIKTPAMNAASPTPMLMKCTWCEATSDTKDGRWPAPDGNGHAFNYPVCGAPVD